MARILMEIKILDDDHVNALVSLTMSFHLELPLDQCQQISSEMHDHFEQVANENSAARAVADTLAHPPAESARVFIQPTFGASTDPNEVYKAILKMNEGSVGP